MQLKTQFFDEYDEMVSVMTSKTIKNFGGKKLPAVIEFLPIEKEGNKTIIERLVWKFDIDIHERFFLPNYMKKLKMIFKIAWRNIYRNKKRSLITISSIFAALFPHHINESTSIWFL